MSQQEGKENSEQSSDELSEDSFCGRSSGGIEDLGKAISQTLVLVRAPGDLSIPVLEIASGLGIVTASFYLVHNEHFWGIALLLLGFILLFLGINDLKLRDRRKRVVQLFQRGFSYQLGKNLVEISFMDIKGAKLNSADFKLKGVSIGTLHELSISCGEKDLRLSSFEHEVGQGPREIDRFVLWAKKFMSAYKSGR